MARLAEAKKQQELSDLYAEAARNLDQGACEEAVGVPGESDQRRLHHIETRNRQLDVSRVSATSSPSSLIGARSFTNKRISKVPSEC